MYNASMSKFYTTNGDDGSTGTLGSERLPKHHPLLQALGAVDEANAALGMARSFACQPETGSIIQSIQRDLYTMMTVIASSPHHTDRFPRLEKARLDWLEEQIRELEQHTPPPKNFILPGDTPASGALALARTITRRAERCISAVQHEDSILDPLLLKYLNRLSSLCFVLELHEIQAPPNLAKDRS